MASEYKKRGGGYNTEKDDQDESQKHLSQWTEEEWQTKEGCGNAKQDDGTEKRYLPKKAWENRSEEEKRETDQKKLEGSKEGKQYVANTGRAKRARRGAAKEMQDKEIRNGRGYTATNAQEELNNKRDEADASSEDQKEEVEQDEKARAGQKRSRGRNKKGDGDKPSKKEKTGDEGGRKAKTLGSKHDSSNAPVEQASADRLPSVGQNVHWKAVPGWVEGTVIEVVLENKNVERKSVKAKEDDPRIVMKSRNGKIAVHKPQAVYFE